MILDEIRNRSTRQLASMLRSFGRLKLDRRELQQRRMRRNLSGGKLRER
jgi:hypothetical protein